MTLTFFPWMSPSWCLISGLPGGDEGGDFHFMLLFQLDWTHLITLVAGLIIGYLLAFPLKSNASAQVTADIMFDKSKKPEENRDIGENNLQTEEAPVEAEDEEKWLDHLKETVLERISDPDLDAESLSKLMMVSKRQFYRKIKEESGKTPALLIKSIRLEKAHELLSSGECRTVKEVGQSVGFKDANYFSTQFKKQFGYPPSTLLMQG